VKDSERRSRDARDILGLAGLRRSMPIVRQGPGLCQTQDLSRHTTDDLRKASISIDFKIFTPLRVGWLPTPQVYFGP
jgi:hypothetical protein